MVSNSNVINLKKALDLLNSKHRELEIQLPFVISALRELGENVNRDSVKRVLPSEFRVQMVPVEGP